MEDPPEDAYGRVTNPQRFAPLIPAANDLISELERRFDVTVTRGPATPWKSDIKALESVWITPVRPDQAPLTVTFTSFPGLSLHAGAWQDIALPACGCDACDEGAEEELRNLAKYSEALTSGELCERIIGRIQPVLTYSWKGKTLGRSGTGTLSRSRAAKLRAQKIQPPDDGQWRAWTRR